LDEENVFECTQKQSEADYKEEGEERSRCVKKKKKKKVGARGEKHKMLQHASQRTNQCPSSSDGASLHNAKPEPRAKTRAGESVSVGGDEDEGQEKEKGRKLKKERKREEKREGGSPHDYVTSGYPRDQVRRR
jgi:hypothetical protein